MEKGQVRVVIVPKWATAALLVVYSAAIMGLVLFLSGRAYAGDRSPALLILSIFNRWDRGVLTNSALVAALMQPLASIVLFVPWGLLAFLVLDRAERPRLRSHGLVTLGGLVFALAIAGWQYALPTRVTNLYDSLWHGLGALTGSMLGYLRKRVHVQFR